jgi:hypothetical protein
MAVGIASKGTYRETGTTSTQAHLMVGWKMAGSDNPTTKPERRETEEKTGGTCSSINGTHF